MLVIAIAAAFFLTFFSEKFITKWFELMNAVLTGILTSVLIIFATSLISYKAIRESNARGMGLLVAKLTNKFSDFLVNLCRLKDRNGNINIPDADFPNILVLLERILDLIYSILDAGKLAPLVLRTFRIFKKKERLSFSDSESAFLTELSSIAKTIETACQHLQDAMCCNNMERKTCIRLTKDFDAIVDSIGSRSRFAHCADNYMPYVYRTAHVSQPNELYED